MTGKSPSFCSRYKYQDGKCRNIFLFEPLGLVFQMSGWEMPLRPSPRALIEGTSYFVAWLSVLEIAKDSSRQHFKLPSGKELCNLNGWTSFVDRIGGGVVGFVGSFRWVGWCSNFTSFLVDSKKCISASSWMGLCFLFQEKMNPFRPSRNSSLNCEDIFLFAHREITNRSSSSSFV